MQVRLLRKAVLFVAIAFLFSACSNIKYLNEGENLYVKGEVEINNDSIPDRFKGPLQDDLEGLLRPAPTSSLFGLMPRLYIYNIMGESEKGIKGWIKNKVGKAPVFLDDVNVEYNQNLLRNRLENRGFFNATVDADTTIKNRKATLSYTANTDMIFRIRNITWPKDTAQIFKEIAATKEESLLQFNRPYNLDNIITEREQIDNKLKDKGYFFFSPDHILVQVDSALGTNQVDMNVKLKEGTPENARYPYKINNIFIYPEYSLQQGNYVIASPDKAEVYKGYHFVDPNHTFRKFALARAMFFNKGDTYNRDRQNQTISQLVGMGTFRFVKSNYIVADTANHLLDVHYYLTPQQKKSIRTELLGKTAAVYNGAEINVSWLHRNAFKAAELFRFSVYGGYEVQSGGGVNINSNFYRYGAEAALVWPRIIAPFNWTPTRRFVPHTTTLVAYEFLNRRQAYRLNSMRFAWGYQWQESIKKDHSLNILDVAYVQPTNVTEFYEDLVAQYPNLQRAIDRQFTFGPVYKFTYTNTMDANRRNTSYFHGGLDLSGNVTGLIAGADADTNPINIFNAQFAQYIKTELEYRHYFKLTSKSTLAGRALVGFGYSYGNSRQMPYVKQFFAGGPNSLRSFRARAIGPGSYNPQQFGNNNFVPDMTGDIRMELNAEYRGKIVSFLDWAAFVDAGNIWLQNEDPLRPGAQFSRDFAKEFAVGGGLGLRFDFSVLVLRTDFAIPFRLPYLPENERWVFNRIDFGNSTWRSNNLVFNLAIGYPF